MSNPEIDAAYNAKETVPVETFNQAIADYRSESLRAVENLKSHSGIYYDSRSSEALDVWGVDDDGLRPVVVAFHGGYWRLLSRHDTAFMAETLADAGVATVSVDYSLAPAVTLEEIVRQIRTSIAWVHTHGADHGLDPSRIYVLGSSAGGHLAAMVGVDGWQADFGLPNDVVKGMLLISGLFDLRPLVDSFANEWLQLDQTRAANLSPQLSASAASSQRSALVVVAEYDSSGFHDQSRAFHDSWSVHSPSQLIVVPDRNHYDVFLDLADSGSDLTRLLLGMICADERD